MSDSGESEEEAPQDLAGKLQRVRHTEGPARRKLSSLRKAWGFRFEREDEVSTFSMDRRTYWRRVDRAKDPWFEYEREEREEPPKGEQWTCT